jgi:hypothetical protein
MITVPSSLTDIATNGTFAADSDWTKGDDWTIAGGVAVRVPGAGTSTLRQTVMTVGDYYLLQFDIASMDAGTMTANLGDTQITPTLSSPGTYIGLGVCIVAGVISFDASAAANLTLDNVFLYHLQEDLANGETPVIERLDWSYDGANTGYVEVGGPTGSLWRENIVAAGPDSRQFACRGQTAGLVGTKDRALVVVIGAGGDDVGKLNVEWS